MIFADFVCSYMIWLTVLAMLHGLTLSHDLVDFICSYMICLTVFTMLHDLVNCMCYVA